MLQLSVLTPGCIHLAGIYFSCLNIFSIFLEILHWPGKKQIIMSQIVLILLFSCLLGLFASNLWCCICALEDFYICSLADFCICRLALFHFPKHLFSVELWLVNSCKCKSMKCLLHTVLPHSNMGWLHTQDNKLANVKATWVQLFFHVTWRAKVFYLFHFPEFMRFENAVVRKLWKAWLFFLPDNRENTLIPLQSPVINTPF